MPELFWYDIKEVKTLGERNVGVDLSCTNCIPTHPTTPSEKDQRHSLYYDIEKYIRSTASLKNSVVILIYIPSMATGDIIIGFLISLDEGIQEWPRPRSST